ncbi:hypothetical protein [Pseudoalteromonas rubra]|uniref:Uncharacterized protein n=1 Tax=Pseudoalteromonas rubra TaxID=43658 RepID=A0A0U3GWL3_9GAMM|nr:hypothetical protein [Pseudoalteromonas rubra]ALU44686.1 hypothetical protein AT705_18105 [Pseudoalteromonas rubra]
MFSRVNRRKYFAATMLIAGLLPLGAMAKPHYISKIHIDGVFSIIETYASHAAKPACVSAQNKNKWVLNTSTAQGQSMYLALLSAAIHKLPVTAETTQNCREYPALESLKAVTLEH